MKTYEIVTINMISKLDDGIFTKVSLDDECKDIKITEGNLYDLMENPEINNNMWLFAVNDRYPAVKLYYNKGVLIAEYTNKFGSTINILDRSPRGIMKWLYRILDNTPDDKLFELNRGILYNE